MMDCNGGTPELHLHPGKPISERVDDGAIGSEDGTSKLWERVEADERRIGSEECLKLWMELEARCGSDGRISETIKHVDHDTIVVPSEPKFDDGQIEEANREETSNNGDITMQLGDRGIVLEERLIGDRQGSTNPEKEEWSSEVVILMLEAYEKRLVDGRVGTLNGKEWEEVTLAVNKHLDRRSGANKTLQQCKKKVYALRRWYKTVFFKQMTFPEDEFEHTLLGIMERIMTPAGPCPAGIPGGIDAGGRIAPMPLTPSLFDEEDEEAELIQAAGAWMPSMLGGGFVDAMVSSMQLGRVTGIGADNDRKRKAEQSHSAETIHSTRQRKPCMSSCGASTHNGEVIGALNNFAKVLAQVEKTKMDIMKDLDRRRTELQMKIAKLEPYQQDQSDTSQPSPMLTLL